MWIVRKYLNGGKNIAIFYYFGSFVRLLTPHFIERIYIKWLLRGVERRKDYDYILDRVSYYNKLENGAKLGENTLSIKEFRGRRKGYGSRYFFDTYQVVRFFDSSLRFTPEFYDLTTVPDTPSIVKSRPIEGDNQNSVVLKLNYLRHYLRLRDNTPFRAKKDKAIGIFATSLRPHRVRFLEMYHARKDIITCGDMTKNPEIDPKLHCDYLSLNEHLKYKFVVCLEGNDVSTSLKWVMSSNSVAMMPRPKYETWYMEGRLVPNYHYIEIADDYSDLEQKMRYYSEHPVEAEQIVRNANAYLAEFFNPRRELIIQYLVMQRYFEKSNQ